MVVSDFQEILTKFSTPLKDNFENYDLWLRFGLTISLSQQSPTSALQAFIECMRINARDPLPAMLAAKLSLEDMNDPEKGIEFIEQAISRCQDEHNPSLTSDVPNNKYENIGPLLSKCYILASVMHAHIYEREPESIRRFKTSHLKTSLHYLDLAEEAYPEDYLIYFHKGLHDANQKSYIAAIDNVRKAIRLNPSHIPSMQLLILLLTASRNYDEALTLCESTLHEFEDNLLLLYIKCNLEQFLVESRGYRIALNTAKYMLKCIQRSNADQSVNDASPVSDTSAPTKSATIPNIAGDKLSLNLFASDGLHNDRLQEFKFDEQNVWLLVAEIFIKIGSLEDAEMCVDEGSKHVDGAISPQIMFVRGLISKARNNLIEAKTFFQSCLALYPRHAKALQQIAHVHHLLGNYTTAEKFLKDSLDIDSNGSKTWHYLSLVFIEQNQHDKASECIKKSSALEESSPIISLSAISRLTLR